MKILNLYKGNYQRNGVAGEGFHSVFCDIVEGKQRVDNFLITFQTDFSEKHKTDVVIPASCRVVKIDQPLENWRGDEFAYSLNDYFRGNGINDIYDYFRTTLQR